MAGSRFNFDLEEGEFTLKPSRGHSIIQATRAASMLASPSRTLSRSIRKKTEPLSDVARRFDSKSPSPLQFELPSRESTPVRSPYTQSTLQFQGVKTRTYLDMTNDPETGTHDNEAKRLVDALEARLGGQISHIMDTMTHYENLPRRLDTIQSQLFSFKEQMNQSQDMVEKLNEAVQNTLFKANTGAPLSPPFTPSKVNHDAMELTGTNENNNLQLEDRVQSIQNIVAVLVDHFEALRRNLDSLDTQTSETYDRLAHRVEASEKNSIARTQNTYVATAGEELAPLVNVHTGRAITKFPKTPRHIKKLTDIDLNGILSEAGCDIVGTTAEKKAKLRAVVGLLAEPEDRA